jgi:hypothetical protein
MQQFKNRKNTSFFLFFFSPFSRPSRYLCGSQETAGRRLNGLLLLFFMQVSSNRVKFSRQVGFFFTGCSLQRNWQCLLHLLLFHSWLQKRMKPPMLAASQLFSPLMASFPTPRDKTGYTVHVSTENLQRRLRNFESFRAC